MPDLLRLLIIFGNFFNNEFFLEFVGYPINESSHSLVGVLALSCLISIFFEESLKPTQLKMIKHQINENSYGFKFKLHKFQSFWKKKIKNPFFLLFLGGLFHLFLDTFMWPWAGGINWLYPFDFAMFRWSFKLWWPSSFNAIFVLFPFFIISLILKMIFHFYKKKYYQILMRKRVIFKRKE